VTPSCSTRSLSWAEISAVDHPISRTGDPPSPRRSHLKSDQTPAVMRDRREPRRRELAHSGAPSIMAPILRSRYWCSIFSITCWAAFRMTSRFRGEMSYLS